MDRTGIILAGGSSRGFSADKGLTNLANKPLILHVIERVQGLVDEIIICVRSSDHISLYGPIVPNGCKVIVDLEDFPACPLTGALTGLSNARGEYSLILPCDTPFISRKVIELLFEITIGVNAVIPRWPNGYIEPLHAVYKTERALESAGESLRRGEAKMQSMISRLGMVRYLSTIVIREINPNMLTFFNINTPMDLRRAETLITRVGQARL